MDCFNKILPILSQIVGKKKKRVVNVTSKENEIIVSIWGGLRWKKFKDISEDRLANRLRQAYGIN